MCLLPEQGPVEKPHEEENLVTPHSRYTFSSTTQKCNIIIIYFYVTFGMTFITRRLTNFHNCDNFDNQGRSGAYFFQEVGGGGAKDINFLTEFVKKCIAIATLLKSIFAYFR